MGATGGGVGAADGVGPHGWYALGVYRAHPHMPASATVQQNAMSQRDWMPITFRPFEIRSRVHELDI